jgi:hypothetical protein
MTEIYFLTVLEDEKLSSRCGQGWFLSEASLLGLYMAISVSLCPHVVIPLCVCASFLLIKTPLD